MVRIESILADTFGAEALPRALVFWGDKMLNKHRHCASQGRVPPARGRLQARALHVRPPGRQRRAHGRPAWSGFTPEMQQDGATNREPARTAPAQSCELSQPLRPTQPCRRPTTPRVRHLPPSPQTFWHSSSHVLGQVLELTFGCDLTIGPALEEGFYYDCFLVR